ncbi:hypothetical protein Lbir_1340 [Legionella birminghamensis]|uniref:Uncharacterized protein n=1 Tax=Legionella birminghamensis TaxID=28083 RepID=A0A378IC88_9GAMM|nr:hypothetical protein [Legionella birminghamensis]KTC72565.1 hypothetical protein Lbir_1340 [Legionella birminghamensis]STX32837.1 Uncharacterised protein [Legionella birminghamensis]
MPVEQIRVPQKWLNKHAILMSYCSYEAKDTYPHALAYGVQQGEIGFIAPRQLPFEVRHLDSLQEGQYFMPLKKGLLYYPLSEEIPVEETGDIVDLYRYTDENDASNSLLFLTKDGPGLFARKYSNDSWSCALFSCCKSNEKSSIQKFKQTARFKKPVFHLLVTEELLPIFHKEAKHSPLKYEILSVYGELPDRKIEAKYFETGMDWYVICFHKQLTLSELTACFPETVERSAALQKRSTTPESTQIVWFLEPKYLAIFRKESRDSDFKEGVDFKIDEGIAGDEEIPLLKITFLQATSKKFVQRYYQETCKKVLTTVVDEHRHDKGKDPDDVGHMISGLPNLVG